MVRSFGSNNYWIQRIESWFSNLSLFFLGTKEFSNLSLFFLGTKKFSSGKPSENLRKTMFLSSGDNYCALHNHGFPSKETLLCFPQSWKGYLTCPFFFQGQKSFLTCPEGFPEENSFVPTGLWDRLGQKSFPLENL